METRILTGHSSALSVFSQVSWKRDDSARDAEAARTADEVRQLQAEVRELAASMRGLTEAWHAASAPLDLSLAYARSISLSRS